MRLALCPAPHGSEIALYRLICTLAVGTSNDDVIFVGQRNLVPFRYRKAPELSSY